MLEWARLRERLPELKKQIQGNQDLLLHFGTPWGRSMEFNKTLNSKTAGGKKALKKNARMM